jgi:hypothetical protein
MDLRTAMQGSCTVNRRPSVLYQAELGLSFPSRIQRAYQFTMWSNSTPGSMLKRCKPAQME